MSIPQSGGGPIESEAQLAEYLASGCKPKEDWRIGTEHEKFGYLKDTLAPLPYDGPRSVKAVLEGMRDRYGWEPVLEGDNIIGLSHDGATSRSNRAGSSNCRARRSGPSTRPATSLTHTCAR